MTMERLEKPPPEKILRRPRSWLLLKNASSWRASMPGMGMAARMRKSTSAASIKRRRERRSSSSMTSFTLCKNVSHICLDDRAAGFFYRGTRRFGNSNALEGEFFGDLAPAHDLDRLMSAGGNDTFFDECLRSNFPSLCEKD